MLSISIVSHGQGELLSNLLDDIANFVLTRDFEIIITVNIPDHVSFSDCAYPFTLKLINNPTPKGFGANHNAAFLLSKGDHFCVMNPDIRLSSDPFPLLQKEMERKNGAMIAPAVVSPMGKNEDSVRHFPTLFSLARKFLVGHDGSYPLVIGSETFTAEWVAGMFMLFRAESFERICGFDEDYFLYYEDVDICARLWRSGGRVLACPKAQVIHDARRNSHHDIRYMCWHLTSMARYFWKHWCRLPMNSF
jgi:GT2 family glycosyltransferase